MQFLLERTICQFLGGLVYREDITNDYLCVRVMGVLHGRVDQIKHFVISGNMAHMSKELILQDLQGVVLLQVIHGIEEAFLCEADIINGFQHFRFFLYADQVIDMGGSFDSEIKRQCLVEVVCKVLNFLLTFSRLRSCLKK